MGSNGEGREMVKGVLKEFYWDGVGIVGAGGAVVYRELMH